MLKKLIAFAILLTVIAVLIITSGNQQVKISETNLVTIDEFYEIPALPAVDTYGMVLDEYDVVEERIQRNESLYIILSRHGVTRETIHYIQQEASGKVSLNRMRPGQKYRVYKDENGASAFIWHRSAQEYTTITWGDEITVENGTIPVDTQIATVSGTIRSSLANAISSQGVSQRLVVELANIYAWTVDFYGLRSGDQFRAVYENRYVNDEYIGIGQIKAAEFEHRGNVLRAYFFHNGEQGGYYDEEGNSMRRAMMRVPFEYNPRISSGFSHNRMHPILNQRRPHYGTDYAAPTGTPILAAGDGVVTEAQHRGGNGNIVQIRHNSVYRTAYLHMSRFASGIRPGVRVQQGQVIGYVGQTGLATGPHLCYRLYKNNTPINSVTYDFPPDEGLGDEFMDEYRAEVKRLDEMLDGLLDSSRPLAGLY
ncbi:MAG: peptidoglycan DD-metalloendopeptidase family protein [Balneolaceae bacterium]|nr:peptidoglycan DD-metalloendopeptidase family protein [Balneolaceae bacterium]